MLLNDVNRLTCLVLVLVCFIAKGQSCPNEWTSFGGRPGANEIVRASAVAPDGTIVIVGGFTACGDVTSRFVARFNPVTQTWSSLGEVASNSAVLNAVTVLPNGDVVVGGAGFSLANGGFSTLARYSPASGNWSALPSTGGTVYALAAFPDGRVLVGGDFFSSGSQPGQNISILNSNLTTWTALGSGCQGTVFGCLVRTSDIVAVGNFSSAGGSATGRVARYNLATGQWSPIGSWTSGSPTCVAALTGGDLAVGGFFSDAGGTFANNIARYSVATNSWSSLSLGLNGSVNAVAYRPGTNDIVAGGTFTTFLPGFPAAGLARFSLTSESWESFGSPTSSVQTLARLSSGALFVGGTFTQANTIPADRAVILGANNGFSPATQSINAQVLCAAAAANGDIIVGGSFTHAGALPVGRIARFNPTTGVWAGLAGGFSPLSSSVFGTSQVDCVAELSNGDIIAGGNFVETSGGVPINGLARFRPSTNQWEAFGFGVARVSAIVPLSGSSFLISGGFDSAGGVTSRAVARFNHATQAWESVGTGMPSTAVVRDLIRTPSGDLYGTTRTGVQFYNATTDQWSTIGTISTNFEDEVDTLVRLPDGRILVAGQFSTIGGINATNLAIYVPATGAWSRVTGSLNGKVRSLLVDGSSSVLIGGEFSLSSLSRGIARFDIASNSLRSVLPGLAGSVYALVRPIGSNNFMAGGNFLTLDLPNPTPAAFLVGVSSGGTPPSITSQPSSRTSCPGVTATFSVVASGSPAPSFQWRRNGAVISGAQNPSALTATLQLPNVSLNEQGSYTCVVTNSCASVTSQAATLTVCPADYDCSGGVDSDDVITFFGDWDASNIRADFNRDGGVDADDVIGFFGRWDAGC
jgi:hypothetical protein